MIGNRRASLVVALALVATLAHASEASAQGRASGFRFGTARVAFGYDTGISISGQQGLTEDRLIQVVPATLTYSRSRAFSDISFTYEPQFEIFGDFSLLDTWNHRVNFHLSRDLTRDLTLRGGGTYLETNDRSQQINTLTLSPRGKYREGVLFIDASYQINLDTSIQFRADGRYTDSQFGAGTVTTEQVANSYRFGLSRNIGLDRLITVGYTYFKSRILRQDTLMPTPGTVPPPLPDEPGQSIVTAGFSQRFRSGWQVSASGGVIRRPGDTLGANYTYMLGGSFTQSWNTIRIGGGYNRTLSALVLVFDPQASLAPPITATPGVPGQVPGTATPAPPLLPSDPTIQSGDPFLANRVAETVDFGLETRLGRRFRIVGGTQMIRTDLPTVDDRIETVYTNATLSIQVGRRFEPYVGATYWYQTTSSVAAASSRTRILVGFQFSWDRPVRAGRGI